MQYRADKHAALKGLLAGTRRRARQRMRLILA